MNDVLTPMRADARRNRDRLLEVAADAFAEHGTGVALDAIAKQAGVGVGTLYRHFPTRDSLIVAVYRLQLEQLRDAVDPLLERVAAGELRAEQALRAWMDHFIEYIASKRDLGEALIAIFRSSPEMSAASCGMLEESVDRFLVVGAADGSLRSDVPGADVFRAMGSVWIISASPGWSAQAGRLFDLLIDGLRPR